MTVQSDLEVAKAKLVTDQAAVDAAHAALLADSDEVSRLEAELAALPVEVQGKTDAELVVIYQAIVKYFGGSVPA